MEVRFRHDFLARLEADAKYDHGLPASVVEAYRRRMQAIRSALDERVFYSQKSLHFEKLKGKREHQHSMRLNAQWRLILELRGTPPNKLVMLVDIEDYH